METWKPVVGYGNSYEISDLGRVRSFARNYACHPHGKILSPTFVGEHLRIGLQVNKKRKYVFIHRLVLEAFVGPCPEEMECCHNNGNAQDNQPANLRWDTHASNVRDMIKHGRLPCRKGSKHPYSKLVEAEVLNIRQRAANGEKTSTLAKAYGISDSHVSNIKSRRIWKHI